jgi:hypothetical protein
MKDKLAVGGEECRCVWGTGGMLEWCRGMSRDVGMDAVAAASVYNPGPTFSDCSGECEPLWCFRAGEWSESVGSAWVEPSLDAEV